MGTTLKGFPCISTLIPFHLKARNLSPATLKTTKDYLWLFLASYDLLVATKKDCEGYLADLADRCRPATIAAAWRHLWAFFRRLHEEHGV
jgi:hypothetical protein